MHEFLPVQHGHAQLPRGQVEGNRSADDPPSNNHDIVAFHANILTVCCLEFSYSYPSIAVSHSFEFELRDLIESIQKHRQTILTCRIRQKKSRQRFNERRSFKQGPKFPGDLDSRFACIGDLRDNRLATVHHR